MRDSDLRPLRQSTSAVLVLCLSMLVAVPSLLATEGEAPESAESTAAQTAEPEKKDNGDEATKKQKKGPSFIPIPIIITEPAVGYGLGAAVGYFHKNKHHEDAGGEKISPVLTAETTAEAGKRQKVPPTISGIAAAYTESGTWALGFAHSASWKQDRMRYVGAIGYAHVVTTFYFNDEPYDFTLDTGLLYQDLKFRIKKSDFWVGGKLIYLTPDLVFDEELEDIPEVEDRSKLNDFGLALQGEYDGRDNKMTPNRGQYVELVGWKHFEVLGGETDYWKIGLVVDSFHEFADQKLVLGLHLDLDTAGGDTPIWAYPYVTMRGIPALRYQNESTAVLSTELRWNLAERWAAVGFVGVGATRGDKSRSFKTRAASLPVVSAAASSSVPRTACGSGSISQKDPEQYVVYVVAGHKW